MTNCKSLREMGTPDLLTCLLRNLCAGQEATVRTLYGTTDWFMVRKEVHRAFCCFNVFPEHIMRNAGLDEA